MMTDEQIIKCLEYKTKTGCELCDLKPDIYCQTCITGLSKQALDLINRQKAEIERLREQLSIPDGEEDEDWYTMPQLKTPEEIKTEAIKEFAERLKDCPYFDINNEVYFRGFDIERILKELTQPTKIEHNSLCETETYKE